MNTELAKPDLKIIAWSRRDNDNSLGLKRKEPADPHRDWMADLGDYILGFRAGVQQDFGIVFGPSEIPLNKFSYTAFLNGLGGMNLSSIDIRPTNYWEQSQFASTDEIKRSYELGLKLLLLHLGYPKEQLIDRLMEINRDESALEQYRKDSQDLMASLKPDPKNPCPVMPVYGKAIGALEPNPIEIKGSTNF